MCDSVRLSAQDVRARPHKRSGPRYLWHADPSSLPVYLPRPGRLSPIPSNPYLRLPHHNRTLTPDTSIRAPHKHTPTLASICAPRSVHPSTSLVPALSRTQRLLSLTLDFGSTLLFPFCLHFLQVWCSDHGVFGLGFEFASGRDCICKTTVHRMTYQSSIYFVNRVRKWI